jgi:hypothetical protein
MALKLMGLISTSSLFSNQPHGPPKVWLGKNKNFFNKFCYLQRVEHDKCSVMCVWIVRFA